MLEGWRRKGGQVETREDHFRFPSDLHATERQPSRVAKLQLHLISYQRINNISVLQQQ
jgi:hypothetical protein